MEEERKEVELKWYVKENVLIVTLLLMLDGERDVENIYVMNVMSIG